MRALMTLMAAVLLNACVHAREGSYYRAWQGFSKTTPQEMVRVLPAFMTATVDLYAKNQALSNYIVIVPPATAPAYIPHELALVALTAESDYRRIRATEEGAAYSAAHWDVFSKETSVSAPMKNFADEPAPALVSGTAYNVLAEPLDWSKGVNYVFIGLRKEGVKPADFLKRLKGHVQLTQQALGGKGLRGYIMIADGNYEIAYMNWESAAAHDQAAATAEAQAAFADAQSLMNSLMYQPTKKYQPGDQVTFGSAYHAF